MMNTADPEMNLKTASTDLENVDTYNDDEYPDQNDGGEIDGLAMTSPAPRRNKRCIMFVGLFALVVVVLAVVRSAGRKEESSSPASSTIIVESDAYERTKTDAPTTSPTQAGTLPSKQGCVFSDRFDNENNDKNNRLYPGQFICSKNHTNNGEQHQRYRFGLTHQGDLVLEDTMIPQSDSYQYNQVLYSNDYKDVKDGSYYFSLQTDGTFSLHGRNLNQLEWTSSPNHKMHFSEQCLDDHDCPYLHLHRDGVLVIGYVDKQKEYQQKNALHLYSF